MALGEDVAGTAFQIPLEVLRLLDCLERDLQFALPRAELGCMRTLSRIMIREALPEVCGVTDITLIGMAQALDHVSIKHGLPSIALSRYRNKPSFAKPMEGILRAAPTDSAQSEGWWVASDSHRVLAG